MYIRKMMLLIALLCCYNITFAQSFYEDDIYYDASKAKKSATNKQKNTVTQSNIYTSEYNDYPAADTYTVNGTSTRDVDEYNRRGVDGYAGTISADSLSDFTYTRRIERFYNPSIVSSSNDEELKEYYYSTKEQPTEINIYVTDVDYWRYPYSSWYWSWYSPWYYNSWYGPSWYYGPYWSYYSYWGPTWYPGYYPHHYPTYYPSRPAYHPSRPSRPGNNYTPGRRPGTSRNGGYYRSDGSNSSKSSVNSGRRSSNRGSSVSNSNRENTGRNEGYSSSSNSESRGSSYRSSSSGGSRSSGTRGGRSGSSSGGRRGGRH